MTVELGRYGFWRRQAGFTPELAREVEALGFGAIWIGGSPPADLTEVEGLLAATDRIAIATGIVNMWASPAAEVAASYHRIAARYPGRFLLGVGIGHPEATREYKSPYQTIVDYLDVLDEHEVPVADRVLAALRPKALAVAGERTAGTHPYLTTPEHTRTAREQLGAGVLIAPEQTAAIDAPDSALASCGDREICKPCECRTQGLLPNISELLCSCTGSPQPGRCCPRMRALRTRDFHTCVPTLWSALSPAGRFLTGC